jgi:hypothetical protein
VTQEDGGRVADERVLVDRLERGGIPATLRNMRAYWDGTYDPYKPGTVVAVNAVGDRFSADPGDYFWLDDPDDPLVDGEGGEPLELWRPSGTVWSPPDGQEA